jgi:hypothetical protein
MKTKKQKSNNQKALERMERETARAVESVNALSKLYAKMVENSKKT